MFKKATAMILSICIAVGITACGKSGSKSSLTNGYKATMLVTPRSVHLEKEFLDEYKNVENVVLPENYDKNIDKIVDEIAAFAENERVKCIIVCSDKEGLLPVFKKIKEKNEGIITVAAGLEEVQNEEKRNDVDMDENITMGFNPTDKDNNMNAINMTKAMGATTFINYVDEFIKDDVEFNHVTRDMKRECEKNGIKYVQVEVSGMKNNKDAKVAEEFIKKDAISKKKTYGENIALYGCSETMDKATIKAAIENRLMVPNIHSINGEKLYCEILGINSKGEEHKKVNEKISEKLKELNMEARLASTQIPEKDFSVKVAVQMSDKLLRARVEDAKKVLYDIQSDMKESTGIWAEYNNIKYYNNFLRTVEMYPILY